MSDHNPPRRRQRRRSSAAASPPELPDDPMEFLSRSWSASALHPSNTLAAAPPTRLILPPPSEEAVAGNPFTFASGTISELVVDRIMSQSDASPLASGRPSHSGGPFNCGGGDSLSDSPPLSPSDMDDIKHFMAGNTPKPYNNKGTSKTVRRWLKYRRDKKKEESRSENAQLHAAVSVACVASAVAAVAAATAAASGSAKDERTARTDMAVSAAAALVAAQCVEAAESMGAEHEHLASVISSAVNVRTPGDMFTLTAAAATALRAAATLKARAVKEAWNVAAVIPVEKGECQQNLSRQENNRQEKELDNNHSVSADEFDREEKKFLGICYQELLARGSELLKRTRKGALHWKLVSVYINRMNQVVIKMKSRHVAGTIIKKKKSIVIEVCKDVQAWPGRHLLDSGEQRHYFGLKTAEQRVIEFECLSKREYKMWTEGVTQLLDIVEERKQLK